WPLWIPWAVFGDRVPSPLGFVLLVVPPGHLIGTAMGCRTVPVAIPIRALRKPRAYGSASGQALTSSADDELGLDLGRPLGMLIMSARVPRSARPHRRPAWTSTPVHRSG